MTSIKLIKALDRGKFNDVVRYIERNPQLLTLKLGIAELNIVEYVLYKNNSDLLEAVLGEYKDRIKFTVETLLHAINVGNEEAVQTILKTLMYQKF
uniref:Ankyrin repeat protein n=1 Tax=Romanomermis culicivorax TaxID=13658 RepID=A0A915K819_ROMCU